jgi:hypothetical protein
MMEAISSSETSDLTKATRHNITEDVILHNNLYGNVISYVRLTAWTLYRRRDVFPVRYELGFYIQEYGILHSHSRENLKSYMCRIMLCSPVESKKWEPLRNTGIELEELAVERMEYKWNEIINASNKYYIVKTVERNMVCNV